MVISKVPITENKKDKNFNDVTNRTLTIYFYYKEFRCRRSLLFGTLGNCLSNKTQWEKDFTIFSGLILFHAVRIHPNNSVLDATLSLPPFVTIGCGRRIHVVHSSRTKFFSSPLILWSSGCNRQVVFRGRNRTTVGSVHWQTTRRCESSRCPWWEDMV